MIRRPLCFVLSAFIGGIWCRRLLDASLPAGIGGGVLLCCLLLLFTAPSGTDAAGGTAGRLRESPPQKRLRLAVFLALLCGLAVMQAAIREASLDPFALRDGEVARVEGVILAQETVRGEDSDSGGVRMLVKTQEGSRVLVTYYGKAEEIVRGESNNTVLEGRRITGVGIVEKPSAARNPGCFDYALYLKGRRVYALVRLEKASAGEVESGWRHFFACRRAALSEATEPYLSKEQQAVLSAMLFGDKGELSEEVYQSFQRNGTAHVLAVSGLHVGMVFGLFAGVFGRRQKRAGRFLLALLLVSYAALAGFSPSVVRAAVMIGVYTAAGACHARYDMLTGMMTAAAIILAASPYQLFSGGFQLSFTAVLLLAFLQPKCEKQWLPAMLAALRVRTGLTLAATGSAEILGRWLLPLLLLQAGMAPLTAFLFNYVSLSAFAANLPLVFLAGLIVPVGILLVLLIALPFGGFFVPLGGTILSVLLPLLVSWNRLSYLDGRYSCDVVSSPLWSLLLFYGLLFYFLSERTKVRLVRGERKEIAKAAAVITAAVFIGATGFNPGFAEADIVFVDVGQGGCIHLRGDCGTDILVDGGGTEGYDVGRKIVKPYLLKNQVRRVDLAVVTHLDTDHYDGVVSLCREGMAEQLAVYEGLWEEVPRIAEETGMPPEKILLLGPGDVLVKGGITIRCLGPLGGGTENPNEASLVLMAEKGGRRLLITGDIGTETETALAEAYVPDRAITQSAENPLRCDILQVPHHGSKYSSSAPFLAASQPAVCVIQVGANNYGHPAAETLARCEEAGAAVYRNDEQGAVGIVLTKDGLRIRTMRRAAY